MSHSAGISSSPRTVALLLAILVVSDMKSNLGLGTGPPKRKLVGHQEQIVVKPGGTIRLTCPVEADSTLLVEWRKDGHVIHAGRDDRYRLVPSSLVSPGINSATSNNLSAGSGQTDPRVINTLRIRDLTSTDTGLYTCLATNGFGTVDVSFRVYVRQPDSNDTGLPWSGDDAADTLPANYGQPPKFVDSEHMTARQRFAFGSTERLTCASSGEPRPHVTWYKDGDKMQTTDLDYGMTAVEEQLQQLVLDDIQLSDSGLYQCLVSNSYGNISFTYHVTVDDHASLQPELVRSHPHDVNVSFGHTASFLCYVRSPTEPRIQWLKRIDTPTAGVDRDAIGIITPDNPNYVVVGTAPNDDDDDDDDQLHHRQHPIQRQQFESATVKQRDGVYLSKLRIRRVTDEDAGHYVCFTMNHAGYTYREANLTVWKGATNVSDVKSRPLDGTFAMKSSNDVLLHWFFPFVVVAVVLTSVVLLATVGLAIFRRRRYAHRAPSCTSGTAADRQMSHSSGGKLLSGSPSPKTSFVGTTSSSTAAIPEVFGVKRVAVNGLERGGVRQHHASLDKNSHSRRHASNLEVMPLQQQQQQQQQLLLQQQQQQHQSNIDGCSMTGNRNATLSIFRSRHDQHIVERTSEIGLEPPSVEIISTVRRSSITHHVAGGGDLPLLKSVSIGGRMSSGLDKNTGTGAKSSTLSGRIRSSTTARDGIEGGGVGGNAFDGSTGCGWSMNGVDSAVRTVR